jgi:HD superfamily phosphohydrolase
MPDLAQLRQKLRDKSPELIRYLFDHLAPRLFKQPTDVATAISGSAPSTITTDLAPRAAPAQKDFNDPIWKIVTLDQLQAAIVDLPLIQRLRRVRQLGLAYLVYPGAHHSRLEHSIGAMKAATSMFDRMTTGTNLTADACANLRPIIGIAALIHDSGHPACSHVGERVLRDIYRDEFANILEILESEFPDPLLEVSERSSTERLQRRKPPPAAELISALFALSPAMEKFLQHQGETRGRIADVMTTTCGLILGRPANLRYQSDYLHFVKSIISGDIDADKIDYVARDAYFAGMPISADIDRLLSQLTTAKLTQDTNFEPSAIKFGGSHPGRYLLMGIRPAGASALEMFVMTRSYLFERIYGHHKVRAAERMLERLLRLRVMYGRNHQSWDHSRVFDFFFDSSGDDGVLKSISLGGTSEAEQHFAEVARRLLDRVLPKRCLAMSQRTMVDYPKNSIRWPAAGSVDTSLS